MSQFAYDVMKYFIQDGDDCGKDLCLKHPLFLDIFPASNNKRFACVFSAHSPDNTFLGFVVGEQSGPEVKLKKKEKALVYSKQKRYVSVSRALLSCIKKIAFISLVAVKCKYPHVF